MTDQHPNFIQSYFHGTKRNFSIGDLVVPGSNANYGQRKAKFVYATSNLNVAIWGAELAVGDGPGRIYVVEPVGGVEDDPNLTDKKFPGNPTKSYRSRAPLRIVGEVETWESHSPEQLQAMKDGLARLEAEGGMEIID